MLPLPSKVTVMTAVMHAICWLREVVAVFAPAVATEARRADRSSTTQGTQTWCVWGVQMHMCAVHIVCTQLYILLLLLALLTPLASPPPLTC